jgi:UDP-N-acetylglucosamine pyrophosphorylase
MNFEIIQVQIIFSIETKYGTYNDALYFLFNDYNNMSQKDIDFAKQARADAWVAYVENFITLSNILES